MASLPAAERLALLQRSWTAVAAGYRASFVARFAPWTADTLRLFREARPPAAGAIAVPACGPGEELVLLARAFPECHKIVGVDLSEGMVALARQRVHAAGLSERVDVRVGDATRLGDDLVQLAGVISVFGLQQMPDAAAALAGWARALRPGGVLCVCYWPAQVEASGPWALLAQLTAPARPPPDWEAAIPGLAVAEGPAELLHDVRAVHEMSWPSADAFWEAMTREGPWHSRRLLLGDEHMDQLRQRLMAALPAGERPDGAPLVHAPTARIVALRRLPAGPQATL